MKFQGDLSMFRAMFRKIKRYYNIDFLEAASCFYQNKIDLMLKIRINLLVWTSPLPKNRDNGAVFIKSRENRAQVQKGGNSRKNRAHWSAWKWDRKGCWHGPNISASQHFWAMAFDIQVFLSLNRHRNTHIVSF